MREIEGIEQVVEALAPHWDEILSRFDHENARFKALVARDHDLVGRVLKCHLIVEHYVDRFLIDHFKIVDLDSIRLSFFQKAQLLPNSESSAAFVRPGILQLNAVRNRFGHRIDASVGDHDISSMNIVLNIARPTASFVNAIDRIEAFTTVACAFLILPPPHLRSAFVQAFAKVRVRME